MTILTVVAVFDSAAESYSVPIFCPSKGVALRSFMDAISDPKSQYNAHPEHFSLFHLGEFDQRSAVFKPLKTPMVIANAWEMQPRESAGQGS